MTPDTTQHQILYLSRLAPGADFSVVKDIVQLARAKNPPRGITGALLFDGERFCQLLEGPHSEVIGLMRLIVADTRHTDIRMIHDAPQAGDRLLPNWRSGYCESANDLDIFADSAAPISGPEALAAFAALVRNADLE